MDDDTHETNDIEAAIAALTEPLPVTVDAARVVPVNQMFER